MPEDLPAGKMKLLDAALRVFREKGYTNTSVDDLCRAAGLTKGAFFHYFESKEALALAAIERWNHLTGELFASAPYQKIADPRRRLLAYVDFRLSLLEGPAADYTCLLGTLVQETFASHPALREACRAGMEAHAETLVPAFTLARSLYAPRARWSPRSLALYTQAVLQGAFVLAKATGDVETAREAARHLRRSLELLLPESKTSGVSPCPSLPISSSTAAARKRSISTRKLPAPRSSRP